MILAKVFFKCLQRGMIETLPAQLSLSPDLLLKRDELGRDPLAVAMAKDLLDTIPLLISPDPQVNAKNLQGAYAALCLAVVHRRADLVKLLLAHFDLKDYPVCEQILEMENPELLELALTGSDLNALVESLIKECDVKKLRFLLDHARDKVAALPSTYIFSLLSYSKTRQETSVNVLRLLHSYGIPIDPSLEERGCTLLFAALLYDYDLAMELLSLPNPKILQKNRIDADKNWNALMIACEMNDETLIRLIIDCCRIHHLPIQPDEDWTERMRENLTLVIGESGIR